MRYSGREPLQAGWADLPGERVSGAGQFILFRVRPNVGEERWYGV